MSRLYPFLFLLAAAHLAAACEFHHGHIREGFTYNDPSKTNTYSAVDCCTICRSQDRCKSWTRDRQTGSCALKDRHVELRVNPRFDSGIIGGETVQGNVPVDTDCHVTAGKNFNGRAFQVSFTGSADECCRKCQDNFRCYSWTRTRKNGKCLLNSEVLVGFEDKGADGGVVF